MHKNNNQKRCILVEIRLIDIIYNSLYNRIKHWYNTKV